MSTKQVVFVVNTDKDGNADYCASCDVLGGLNGKVKSIQYLADNVIPYEPTIEISFSGAVSGNDILTVSGCERRAEWVPPDGVLNDEPIRIVIVSGGKGRSGSFVVTTE